jgi:hypothetical protein
MQKPETNTEVHVGMMLWAQLLTPLGDVNVGWQANWGGLIECTGLCWGEQGIQAQILNGGHYHGELVSYGISQVYFLPSL